MSNKEQPRYDPETFDKLQAADATAEQDYKDYTAAFSLRVGWTALAAHGESIRRGEEDTEATLLAIEEQRVPEGPEKSSVLSDLDVLNAGRVNPGERAEVYAKNAVRAGKSEKRAIRLGAKHAHNRNGTLNDAHVDAAIHSANYAGKQITFRGKVHEPIKIPE